MSVKRMTRAAARAATEVTQIKEPSKTSSSKASASSISTTTSTSRKVLSRSPVIVDPSTRIVDSPLKRPKTSPTELPTLQFPSASAFESWLLAASAVNPSGIWLKISKKVILPEVPSVSYLEAVDVALCHGWIDGQRKAVDAHFFVQRFTPRRKNSLWSRRNIERVGILTGEGRTKPGGEAEVDAAKKDGRWERAYNGPATMKVPKDFEEALQGNRAAVRMFDGLNKSQRFSFCWRIETAIRPETRKKRIDQFVEMLAEGKSFK